MPRNRNTPYMIEAEKTQVKPITLLRLLKIRNNNSDDVTSIYFNDSKDDLAFYNENGNMETYFSIGFTYSSFEVKKESEIASCTITLDNVSREFSTLASTAQLNGAEAHILRCLDTTAEAGAQMLFVGHIKKAVINEYQIQLELWADYSLKVRVPRLLYTTNDFPYIPASKDVREIFKR